MKYFGPLCSPPTPECGEKVPVPEGKTCLHCELPVLASDSGFILPFVGQRLVGEGHMVGEAPYHRPCMLRALGLEEKKVVASN